ncbi:MAG: tRNA-guanine transglycosylase [Candidatus Pacebacteria bacterium]|nr:tRNA-guanine transglycosylase [Candidatus Paceibacterota bacterium]
MSAINFKIEKKLTVSGKNSATNEESLYRAPLGRAGILTTPHGVIHTPAFVTVGTKATVKGITPEMLEEAGAEVMLANTYHLYLQPGDEIIAKAGGLQGFSGWNGPTMTDSGGFQVFSLGVALGKNITKFTKSANGELAEPQIQAPAPEAKSGSKNASKSEADAILREDGQVLKPAQIDANGVMFRSVIDGSVHYFTPEKSIQIQHNIGADMIFAFDECTSPNEPYAYQAESLDRTHRWAKQSLEYHKNARDSKTGELISDKQAIFGIVQGGRHERLRKESAEVLANMKVKIQDATGADSSSEEVREVSFDGFGIGGSFAKEDMGDAVRWVNEILPEDKPRHLLGIGEAEDLFDAVENGCDLFDCVMPTRNGRTGTLLTKFGKVNIMNAKYKDDFTQLEEGCGCYTCKKYTRAYLNHLFKAKEMLGGTLATVHNLYFTINLVKKIRQSILDDNFAKFKAEFLALYLKRD